ncbi:MAG: restriction endonuclease subunit S [Bacteroidales bacterium]|nr:restriction endonuclease subunit S [Bacteroidales bacterium]
MRFPEFEGEWEKCKLSDIASIIGGGTPDTTKEEYWNGDVQWFTPTEIKANYVSKSQRTISELGLANSSAKFLPKGSILLTSRATIGDCAIALEECTTNQGFQSLIVKNDNSNIFVLNWLKTKKDELIRKAKGSTFLEINKTEIENISICIPFFPEQTKIATFLSLLDDRISTQRQIIEELKSLIKGLRYLIFEKDIDLKKQHEVRLSNILEEYSEKNTKNNLTPVAVGKFGIRKREDIYSKDLSDDYSKNKVIMKDTLVIGMGSTQIDIGILSTNDKYCVSPAYTTYKIKNISAKYLAEYLICINSSLSKKYMIIGARQGKSVDKAELLNHIITIHYETEQQKIANTFSIFDTKLETEKQILQKYIEQKRYLLATMFV